MLEDTVDVLNGIVYALALEASTEGASSFHSMLIAVASYQADALLSLVESGDGASDCQ